MFEIDSIAKWTAFLLGFLATAGFVWRQSVRYLRRGAKDRMKAKESQRALEGQAKGREEREKATVGALNSTRWYDEL
jgi:hypothetical protein